jgi:hypothetical protein
LKDTCQNVSESALTGPPMIVPWFPCASTPIAFVLFEAVAQTESWFVASTVMPTASVGEELVDPTAPLQVMPYRETIKPSLIVKAEFVDMCG